MEASLANLRQLLPLRVYATLENYVAEADVMDFITLAGDVFKIGVLIVWNGHEYRNPCKAGLAMTQSLRLQFGLQDTKSNTFDGWHRLRVILRTGTVLRLDELLTPEIRRNTVLFTTVPDSEARNFLEDVLPHMLLRSTTGPLSTTPLAAVQASREFLILQPYLTVLCDFCGTNNVPDIARLVKALPVDTVCDILDSNARRMLAALHQ